MLVHYLFTDATRMPLPKPSQRIWLFFGSRYGDHLRRFFRTSLAPCWWPVLLFLFMHDWCFSKRSFGWRIVVRSHLWKYQFRNREKLRLRLQVQIIEVACRCFLRGSARINFSSTHQIVISTTNMLRFRGTAFSHDLCCAFAYVSKSFVREKLGVCPGLASSRRF